MTSWPPWRIGLCWQATRAPSAGPYGMGGPVRRAIRLPLPHAGGTNAINAVPRYAAERLPAAKTPATPMPSCRSEDARPIRPAAGTSVRPTILFVSAPSRRPGNISLRHAAAHLPGGSRPHGPAAAIGWSSPPHTRIEVSGASGYFRLLFRPLAGTDSLAVLSACCVVSLLTSAAAGAAGR